MASLVVPIALALGSQPAAHAAPVDMAPRHEEATTRDGWTLSVDIADERVNSVPNLAGAVNSREAFVSFSATARALGAGSPITDSVFIAGYQLGCQSDVSSGLGIGGAGAVGGNASLMGVPAAAGGLTGFVQTTIQPGVIVDVPMVNMALNEGTAMLDVRNIHIKADACGGDVTIRSYAYLRTSSAAAHTEFATYGDPIKI
ncbi:MAG: MspA family porin [Actinomycetota bacterium]